MYNIGEHQINYLLVIMDLTWGFVQSEIGLYIQLFRSHQEYASVANSKTITFKTTIDGQEYENAVAPGTYYWFAIVE